MRIRVSRVDGYVKGPAMAVGGIIVVLLAVLLELPAVVLCAGVLFLLGGVCMILGARNTNGGADS